MKNFPSHSPGAVIGFFIQWKESATLSEASVPTFSRVWPFGSMVLGLEGEGGMAMGWGSSLREVGAGSADTQMLELSRISRVASGHNPAPLREESWMPSRVVGGEGWQGFQPGGLSEVILQPTYLRWSQACDSWCMRTSPQQNITSIQRGDSTGVFHHCGYFRVTILEHIEILLCKDHLTSTVYGSTFPF